MKIIRMALWLVVLAVPLAATWLVATESGLQAAVDVAHSLTDGQLELKGPSGRLVGVTGFDEVVYSHPASTVRLRDVRVQLRLSRLLMARVQAETLTVAALTVTTHARDPQPESGPLTVVLPLRIAVEDGHIGRFQLQLRDGDWSWAATDIRLAARWSEEWIVMGKVSAVTTEAGKLSANGQIAFIKDQLRLKGVEVQGSGSLKVDGALALSDTASNHLELQWKPLRWIGLEELESRRGQARIEGRWGNYGWKLEGHLKALDIDGDITARGRGSLEHLAVHRLELATLDGQVRGSGRVAWAGTLHTAADLEFEKLNPGAVSRNWNGTVSGTSQFSGTWAGAVPSLEFDVRLRDSQLRGYPLSLAARGNTRNRRVLLHELDLKSGVSRLRAQGRLLPDFDLAGELASPDLQSLWAGLSGSTNLQVTLKGRPEAARLMANGTATELAWRPPSGGAGYRAEKVQLAASLSATAASDFRIELGDADLGIPLQSLVVAGRGTLRQHAVSIDAMGGIGAGSTQLDGGYQNGQWRGTVARLHLSPAGQPDWDQTDAAAVQVSAKRWSLGRLCLENRNSRICADGESAASGQRLAAELEEFELANLQHWLPAEWTLSGSLSGTGSMRWTDSGMADARAQLQASAGSLEGAGVKMEYGPGSLRIDPDGQRLRARLRLTPAGGDVVGDVWLAPGTSLLDRALTGELQASLPDLGWLPVLSSEIASASGSLDSRLTLSGSLRSPSLQGQVTVTDARVQLATPGIELTGITALFESRSDVPLGVSVRAESGGGYLQLDGGLQRIRPQIEGHFRLTGEAAQWVNTPEIRAWVSPNLDLELRGPASKLTGEIRVPRAAVTPRELTSGGVGPSADQLLVESGAPSTRLFQLESQVRIVLGEQVRIDGLGLKTRLEGTLDANDRPGRPTRGFGELRLVGGRYKAYGQDLTIETGRLLFNGGLITEPGIELSAYRQPDENVRVGLRARGPLAAPRFSLYSDPAMSQEEQLSWLILGRPLTETLQSGQRTEIDSAATSLGFAGGEYLAQQLAPKVGLDEVSVGTRPGETNEQARLTIGKYLSPRLFVSYGFGLFQPGQFFRLQYDLGKGFKLSGESGIEQGGDVIYTIER